MSQNEANRAFDGKSFVEALQSSMASTAAIWSGTMAASTALETFSSLSTLMEQSPSPELVAAYRRLLAQRMLTRFFGIPGQGAGAFGVLLEGEERVKACTAALGVLDNVLGLDSHPTAYVQFAALDIQASSDWGRKTEGGDSVALIEAQAVLELSARILRGEIDPQLPWLSFPFTDYDRWAAEASPRDSWDPYEVVLMFRLLGTTHREMYEFVRAMMAAS
jgi:hypothetical protein